MTSSMTLSRALARRVVHGMRRVDHAVGRLAGRRRLLIEGRTAMNLAVLRPVIDALQADQRIRVHFTGPERDDLRRAFAELQVERQVVSRDDATWMRWDLYLNADPWEAVSLRRARRQLNFFHGVAGKYDLDCPTQLPLGFDRYDAVAFPNAARRDAYVAAGIVAPARAFLVGYPKVDPLVNEPGDPREHAASLGLDASRPTAIFAPTFSPASALNQAGEQIIQTLLVCGCNVIAKLHDRSLDRDPRYTGGVNWRERLGRYTGPRFLLADSGDSTPYVRASDLMVTDHSSVGFEFYALGRPLIVYDVPELIERARINPLKVALLRSAADVVRNAAELAHAARAALADPARRRAERLAAANEVFHRPGTATSRALHLISELIHLPGAGAGRRDTCAA